MYRRRTKSESVLARRRLELHVFEIVVIVFVADLFAGPEAPAEQGVDFRDVGAILQRCLLVTGRLEFVRKGAEAKAHNNIIAERAEARHRLRQVNRTAVRDHRAGAESQLLTNRRNGGKNQQALYMSIIFAFHAVRFKDQMVSHPNRVKAISLGLF